MSTVLALLFFETVGTFALQNAADLVSVELYALLAVSPWLHSRACAMPYRGASIS
jgi:hypothetical protein